MKINQIPYVIFQITRQYFFKYCITIAIVPTPLLFFSSNIPYFGQKKPIKVKFWDF